PDRARADERRARRTRICPRTRWSLPRRLPHRHVARCRRSRRRAHDVRAPGAVRGMGLPTGARRLAEAEATRPRVEATRPRLIPDPGARGQDARRSARLERASDGATPWAERFDRTLEGLFAVAGRASARRSTARRGLRDLGGVDARAAALVLAAIRPGS